MKDTIESQTVGDIAYKPKIEEELYVDTIQRSIKDEQSSSGAQRRARAQEIWRCEKPLQDSHLLKYN